MTNEQIARVTHEANRAYCLGLGDESQLPWNEAPQWQRDSALKGVECALKGASPAELHDSWLTQKLEEGWKYGPVKDADKKEHPCMVLYENLPKEQRRKDHLFGAVVSALSKELL